MSTTTAEAGLTIAQASAVTGLSAHTLRYYERDGLMLDAVDRDPGGRRRYSPADISWTTMLTRLRATGMPVSEVRRYAALVRAGDGNEAERLALLRAHRDRVRTRLAEEGEHLAAIEAKVAIYEGRATGC
ncbi:MAG: MerR family transcriptional regulator [Actinobacteria bacterium]|nr:MerR family transcriptional regulator [Actinomycetota bacterium]MCG2801181.1 MerR family transcriptional regulator [Cellulomonas sp.]